VIRHLRVDSSVNTSTSLELREGAGLKDLAWGDLVGGNAYLAGVTSEDDMMARLDARLDAKLQRDLVGAWHMYRRRSICVCLTL
jgi:hypothetical protein